MNFLKQKWNRLFLSKVEGANQPLAAVSTADLASFQNPITNWGITLVRHFTHARTHTHTHSHTCTHPHLNLLSHTTILHVSNLSLSLSTLQACTSEHTCSEYSLTQKQRSLASLYLTLSTVTHTHIYLHPCPCTHHSHLRVCANSPARTPTRTHTHLHAHTLARTHTPTHTHSHKWNELVQLGNKNL